MAAQDRISLGQRRWGRCWRRVVELVRWHPMVQGVVVYTVCMVQVQTGVCIVENINRTLRVPKVFKKYKLKLNPCFFSVVSALWYVQKYPNVQLVCFYGHCMRAMIN